MIGQTISHYKITSKLGEGGMGEVYRATDTKLNRDVALKVLPEAFATDRERMVRFSREAQVLASLNHPNIASIYGLEDSDDKHALVLELVEGETLAERVGRGAIPLEESLKIALQMAEALEAAHEKGIIHRDLKPANVKITPEGVVKVLDFGLAKALEDQIPDADLTHSPTRTDQMTNVGVIMGTAAYMSPEQARGKPVDKRADIWAFGCVLYECLAGRQVFGGDTVTDIIAAILKGEPDWDALPEQTSWRMRDLLRRCLQKNLRDRLRDIGDAGIEVREALGEPVGGTPLRVAAPPPWSSWQRVLPWVLVGGMAMVILAWALIDSDEVPEQSQRSHLLISPPETLSQVRHPSISPDGKQIVFGGLDDNREWSLWVRRMDSPIAERLQGTRGVHVRGGYFWSPDSRFVGFFAGGSLKRIEVSGGPSVSLADAPFGWSGTWNREGTIIFDSFPPAARPLYRVSAAGGEATPITTLDQSRQEVRHGSPYFLPDGRHFLYAAGMEETAAIYLGSVDSKERKFLVNASFSKLAFAPPGYLIFMRDETLMAQRFDVIQLEVSGEPFPIAEVPSFSVSDNGILVFTAGDPTTTSLAWHDRSGKLLGSVNEAGGYSQIVLSPDQERVAVERRSTGLAEGPLFFADIWLLELSSGIFSRFTFHPDREADPIWSPDGKRVAFASYRNGLAGLFQKSFGGSEVEELFRSEEAYFPEAWSKDGDIILFSWNPESGNSVYALRLGEDEEPRLLLEDRFHKDEFHVSPDQRWISYNSDQTGRSEVYVASFPDFSETQQVSRDGGCQALWRGDGKELFYLQLDGKMMSVEVKVGSTLETGISKVLFQTGVNVHFGFDQYCVTGDGQRFLLIEPVEGDAEPIHVVLNWFEELKRLASTGE